MVMDTAGFDKMKDRLNDKFGGKDQPEKVKKVVTEMAAIILGRTSQDLGVPAPKGKFSKSINAGRSHIRRRYTWNNPPVYTRGANAGMVKPHYAHVVKSIKIGNRKFKLKSYINYVRRGSTTLVQNKLTQIRTEAMARVASGKAIWYKMAKQAGLKTSGLRGGHFKDRADLIKAMRSAGATYRMSGKGEQVIKNGEHYVHIDTKTHNSLNPKVRGEATFRKKIKGASNEFNMLAKKGYISSIDDIMREFNIS